MARTYRRDDRRNKMIRDGEDNDHRMSKENSGVRTRHARTVRHHTRQALQMGKYDELPFYPHTSGWETW